MTASSNQNKFRFKNRGIHSVESLARQLGISLKELMYLSENASSLYRVASTKKKSNGEIRRTYDAKPRLKPVLTRLRLRVLEHLELPDYVTAGKRGSSYIDNAKTHLNSRSILSEDVQNFFPSISLQQVRKVFQYLYSMSLPVAELLSKLTTKDGFLPQGSPVSGLIANAVFFDKEPDLVESLHSQGLKYTRYYDDIHVSSQDSNFAPKVGPLRTDIYGMLKSVGLEPHSKPEKSNFIHVGKQMAVHGIIVNNEQISPNPKIVSSIRAMLHQLRLLLETNYKIDDVLSLALSCRGKIQTLKNQGDKKTEIYSRMLAKLIANIDEMEAKKYARRVRKVKDIKDYRRLQARLSVLKSVNPKVRAVIQAECEAKRKKLKVRPRQL